jgi:hypothetical protein
MQLSPLRLIFVLKKNNQHQNTNQKQLKTLKKKQNYDQSQGHRWLNQSEQRFVIFGTITA